MLATEGMSINVSGQMEGVGWDGMGWDGMGWMNKNWYPIGGGGGGGDGCADNSLKVVTTVGVGCTMAH